MQVGEAQSTYAEWSTVSDLWIGAQGSVQLNFSAMLLEQGNGWVGDPKKSGSRKFGDQNKTNKHQKEINIDDFRCPNTVTGTIRKNQKSVKIKYLLSTITSMFNSGK